MIVPTAEQLDAFKHAWESADQAGLSGMRTLVGLTAALNTDTSEEDEDWG